MNEEAILISTLFSWVIAFIVVCSIIGFFSWVGKQLSPKTKEYRENLCNLYVAGKIKQIADKDGVDVENEVKEFRRFEKLMKSSSRELDKVIENEMKEKIQEDFEKAKEKPSKK